MKPFFTQIDIPEYWTAEQAYAISDFFDSIMSAIWEVHDQKIVEVIVKNNEIINSDPIETELRSADDHRSGSDNFISNDDDLPF